MPLVRLALEFRQDAVGINIGMTNLTLRWTDTETGQTDSFSIDLDGRKTRILIGRKSSNAIVLQGDDISREHAELYWKDFELILRDKDSMSGTRVGDVLVDEAKLDDGSRFRIGSFEIAVELHRGTIVVKAPPLPPKPLELEIPPFMESAVVDESAVFESGLPVEAKDFLAIGGGMGSFIWVDHLRIYGVKEGQIRVIGLECLPYAKYRRLCKNSQIPDRERLRSNSESCPDNIWGYPGYALRESMRELKAGNIAGAIMPVWQVFGEPTLATSYVPKAGDVFDSVEIEAKRIGWENMWQHGRAVAIRKTDKGRYVVVYNHLVGEEGETRLAVCKYLHICVGYPGTRLLPDLQDYRKQTDDEMKVVNAYEDHEHVYRSLAEKRSGTVVLRGKGIVASRILQRLSEERDRGCNLQVIHLMRSPVRSGGRYGLARRRVLENWEFQPFNWPKSCWGGELRELLENGSPQLRSRLMDQWGGTTTAWRSDWVRIIKQGKRTGWHRIIFGTLQKLNEAGDDKLELSIDLGDGKSHSFQADYIIDCTGLIPDVTSDPLLRDLIETYELPRNIQYSPKGESQKGLAVSKDFEVETMRNGEGRVYSAGVVTSFGPMAAVDSFLGLQFSALHSVDSLRRSRAAGIRRMSAMRSFFQWLKWCARKSP